MQTSLERSRAAIYLGGKPAKPADDLNVRCEEEGMSKINFRFLFWRIGYVVA